MPQLINWDILREPYNWIMVVALTMFGLLFLHLIMPENPAE